jgi:hypothetical protein
VTRLDACAYKAKDPAPIVALSEEFQAELNAWHDRLDGWLDTLTPEGCERRQVLVTTPGAWGFRQEIVGINIYPHERETGQYPAGWRKRAKDDHLTPYGEKTRNIPLDARQAAAVARAAIKDMQAPKPFLTRLADYGMPRNAMTGNRIVSPAVRPIDGEVYVYWPIPADRLEQAEHPEEGRRHRNDLVDLDRWERIPLSQWYAVLEAEEAKAL